MDRVRVAFYVLLFANLAYLAWSAWVVPGPSPVADPYGKLPRLRLISEEEAPLPSTRTVEVPLTQCISVGPFDDLSSATRGVLLLRTQGFESRQRNEPAAGREGYWVYIAGLLTPDAVKLTLQSLRNDGIEEATALQVTPEERRIAVGFFTQRDEATLRLQELRRLGFKGQATVRRLPSTLYWVDVSVSPRDTPVPVEGLYRGPMSRIGAIPCPDGSSPPAALPDDPRGRRSSRRGVTAVASIPQQP